MSSPARAPFELPPDQKAMSAILTSKSCWCARRKQLRRLFCEDCFALLPPETQQAAKHVRDLGRYFRWVAWLQTRGVRGPGQPGRNRPPAAPGGYLD